VNWGVASEEVVLTTGSGRSSTWVICTLWLAMHEIALAKTLGDLRKAMAYLSWTVERTEPSGVLAEQYHPYSGDPISVSPLTWSHATFVSTCAAYLRKRDEILAGDVAQTGSSTRAHSD